MDDATTQADKTPREEVATQRNAPLPGIPGFVIEREIGAGGMARVYLASDAVMKRKVAIKLLVSTRPDDPGFESRFEREAEIVGDWKHPNIVTVHTRGVTDGRRYIVMEYLPGGTLQQKLRGAGRLRLHRALQVAHAISGALAYAHARQIIHRDVKPSNIMFADDGTPVLCDFGIAKLTRRDDPQTTSGLVMGTPDYMAPEHISGDSISNKIDVFAMGLVLYDMLLGLGQAGRWQRGVSDRTQVEELKSSLPANAQRAGDLIARCLDVDPDKRPSAEACVEALHEIQGGVSPSRFRIRTKWLAYALLLAVVVASAALLIWWQEPRAMLDRFIATFNDGTTARRVNIEGLAPNALTYVDGTRVAPSDLRALLESKLNDSKDVSIVAPLYVGWRGTAATLAAGTAVEMPLLGLPSREENDRFQRILVRSTPPKPFEIFSFAHWPFRRVLELKAAVAAEDQEAASAMIGYHRVLAELGDQSSALFLYFAGSEDLVPDDVATLKARVETAALSGYGLASYYLGRHTLLIDKRPRKEADRWFELAREQGYAG